MRYTNLLTYLLIYLHYTYITCLSGNITDSEQDSDMTYNISRTSCRLAYCLLLLVISECHYRISKFGIYKKYTVFR